MVMVMLQNLGREPAAAEIHEQGFGWNQKNGLGKYQVTSRT
jgi:catalase-peroxidase